MVFYSSDLADLAAMKKDCAALKEHNDEEGARITTVIVLAKMYSGPALSQTNAEIESPAVEATVESAAGPDTVATAVDTPIETQDETAVNSTFEPSVATTFESAIESTFSTQIETTLESTDKSAEEPAIITTPPVETPFETPVEPPVEATVEIQVETQVVTTVDTTVESPAVDTTVDTTVVDTTVKPTIETTLQPAVGTAVGTPVGTAGGTAVGTTVGTIEDVQSDNEQCCNRRVLLHALSNKTRRCVQKPVVLKYTKQKYCELHKNEHVAWKKARYQNAVVNKKGKGKNTNEGYPSMSVLCSLSHDGFYLDIIPGSHKMSYVKQKGEDKLIHFSEMEQI
eukprot:scaffold21200_cov51-Attheya_sp.AAC.1